MRSDCSQGFVRYSHHLNGCMLYTIVQDGYHPNSMLFGRNFFCFHHPLYTQKEITTKNVHITKFDVEKKRTISLNTLLSPFGCSLLSYKIGSLQKKNVTVLSLPNNKDDQYACTVNREPTSSKIKQRMYWK